MIFVPLAGYWPAKFLSLRRTKNLPKGVPFYPSCQNSLLIGSSQVDDSRNVIFISPRFQLLGAKAAQNMGEKGPKNRPKWPKNWITKFRFFNPRPPNFRLRRTPLFRYTIFFLATIRAISVYI